MKLVKQKIRLPEIYGVHEKALEQKAHLLEMALEVAEVTCPHDQVVAVNRGRDLRQHINEVEKTRKELVEPLLQAQRRLKELADDHCGPLKAELKRIEGLVQDFQKSEADRVKAEEKQRQEAIAKLATEQGPSAPAVQAMIRAPLPAPAKANGTQNRRVLKWEVTNIHLLYAAHPELVRIEPNASAIQSTCVPEIAVPGLKLWWADVTTIKTW